MPVNPPIHPRVKLLLGWAHSFPKLSFVSVDNTGAQSQGALGKQSFQDKCVTKLELGHEGAKSGERKMSGRVLLSPDVCSFRRSWA